MIAELRVTLVIVISVPQWPISKALLPSVISHRETHYAILFDIVISMFNNFGICGGYKETMALLVELNRLLRNSGVIVASSLHATKTDKVEHLRYHEANRKRGLSPGLVTIRMEYNGEVGDWFRLLFASPGEMRSLSERAGLKLVRTIKQADNAPYIGVIRKEKQQV